MAHVTTFWKLDKQKWDETMNKALSTIGLCSIVVLIFYLIKKFDDYLYFKREEYHRNNFYEDSDEESNKSTYKTNNEGNKNDSMD